MKRNLLLTLLAAALCVGCASQPVVQSRGNLQEVAKQGTTYHLDARRSGLGENEIRGLRDRLQKAGLSPASAETAKLIVTVTSDLQSSTERQHTGGKNGVAYDRKVDERRLTLTVTESRPSDGLARVERRHTGGKNGVTYDHRIGDRGVLLEVSSTDVGSTSAQTLLAAALAGLGN
jgi:TolA-binding protein